MFYFSFSFQKMPFALGRKCYVRNLTITKFCGIGTGDFRFRFSAEKGISFSSAFSFTAENEKCIFGRPLHQSISDYTLRQWFSNIQQSRFWTACRCLEKLVLPSIFDTSLHHHQQHHRRPVFQVTAAPLSDPRRSQISTAYILPNLVEPDVQRATGRSSPAGLSPS